MKYSSDDVAITVAIVDEQIVAVLTPMKSPCFSQIEVLEISSIPFYCKAWISYLDKK